jgi:hypothetical protein
MVLNPFMSVSHIISHELESLLLWALCLAFNLSFESLPLLTLKTKISANEDSSLEEDRVILFLLGDVLFVLFRAMRIHLKSESSSGSVVLSCVIYLHIVIISSPSLVSELIIVSTVYERLTCSVWNLFDSRSTSSIFSFQKC